MVRYNNNDSVLLFVSHYVVTLDKDRDTRIIRIEFHQSPLTIVILMLMCDQSTSSPDED